MSIRFQTTFYITTAILCGVCCEASAQSIWAARTEQNSLLFFDTRARNVGDLVTVLIAQQTGVNSTEDRGMSKSSSNGGLFDLDLETAGKFGAQAASGAFDFGSNSSREFDGESNYQSAQGFTDQMTATVIDVMPNGNLVIEGRRETMVAGESRCLVLSGIVRPIDLNTQNAVHSRFIANFRLTYEGVGASQSFTRQGWLSRRVNRLWPF